MLEPLRYRSAAELQEFVEVDDVAELRCAVCGREAQSPVLCQDCGRNRGGKHAGSGRPFCMSCFKTHHGKKRERGTHRLRPAVSGLPVEMETVEAGDEKTYPRPYQWVGVRYRASVGGVVVEDCVAQHIHRPIFFQSGTSGPALHLQLLGCTNLAAADILGTSDPFCVVLWGGLPLGTTPVRMMTLNPQWSGKSFVLPIGPEFLDRICGRRKEHLEPPLPKLRVEVFDYDRVGSNDFLGEISLTEEEILQALAGEEVAELDLPLEPRGYRSGGRGRIGLRVNRRDKGVHAGDLVVQVCCADGLPSADAMGTSDPYCRLLWNGQVIGQTQEVRCTLTPKWANANIFVIPQTSSSSERRKSSSSSSSSSEVGQALDTHDSREGDEEEGGEAGHKADNLLDTLVIEVWDWDRWGGHDPLGRVEIGRQHLEELADRTAALEAELSLVAVENSLALCSLMRGLEDAEWESSLSAGRVRPSVPVLVPHWLVNGESECPPVSTDGQEGATADTTSITMHLVDFNLRSGAQLLSDKEKGSDAITVPLTAAHHLQIAIDQDGDNPDSSPAGAMAAKLLRTVGSLWKHVLDRPSSARCYVASLGSEPATADELRGARLSWFPLSFLCTNSEDLKVQGSMQARIIYHSRGAVIRGLDHAVSRMSLGEKASVTIRADYAAGECWLGHVVPPYSRLHYELRLVQVGGKEAAAAMLKKRFREEIRAIRLKCFLAMMSFYKPNRAATARLQGAASLRWTSSRKTDIESSDESFSGAEMMSSHSTDTASRDEARAAGSPGSGHNFAA
jgi:hypothetical protein